MPLSSGLSIHDDTKHKGSAKRDTVSGLAGLSSGGHLLLKGSSIYMTRDGVDKIFIIERVSGEAVAAYTRMGANDYTETIRTAAGWFQMLHSGNVDIANGIAGLDASALIPVALLPGIGERYIISNDLLHSHDATENTVNMSYEKSKTITVNGLYPTPSTIRIKFDLASNATAYGRIYKNGVAVGTERTRSSSVWETFTEDLSFAAGDTLELWLKSSSGSVYATLRNFRIYGIVHSQTLAEAINESEAGGPDAWTPSNS